MVRRKAVARTFSAAWRLVAGWRGLPAILLAVWLAVFPSSALADAQPDHRIALVIGNGPAAKTGALAMKSRLEGGGFTVTLLRDGDHEAMAKAIAAFRDSIGPHDLAVVYYAGTAFEQDGEIFLAPVGASLASPSAAGLEAIDLGHVTPRHALATVVFLDAMADPQVLRRLGAADPGVHPVAPPAETLVVTARSGSDGGRPETSMFTPALLNALGQPGLDADDLVRQLGRDVRQASGGAQAPARFGELSEAVVLHPGAPVQAVATPAAPAAGTLNAQRRAGVQASANPSTAPSDELSSQLASLGATAPIGRSVSAPHVPAQRQAAVAEPPPKPPVSPAPQDAAAPMPAPDDDIPPPQFPRPKLLAVMAVPPRDHFCSAEARNAFIEKIYDPAKAASNRNSALLNAYLDTLSAEFEQYRDVDGGKYLRRLMDEFNLYKSKAEAEFAQGTQLGRLFDVLVAAPISGACEPDPVLSQAAPPAPAPAMAQPAAPRTPLATAAATASAPPAAPPPSIPTASARVASAPSPMPPVVAPTLAAASDMASCEAGPATECQSVAANSVVRIVRRPKESKDPLTRFGAGFFVVVFNKADAPVAFGPSNIQVSTLKGRAYAVLSDDEVERRRKAAESHAGNFGMVMGIGMMALGGVSAVSGASNSQYLVNSNLNTAQIAFAESASESAEVKADQSAITAAYHANSLKAGPVASLAAASGRIIVDKLDDHTPAVIVVTVGGDTHRIVFGATK